MKRRVIKQGNNTLTITLPRKWAEKHGIKAGEEVEVEEKGEGLIILTLKGKPLPVKEIDLTRLNLLIPRVIHALYKKGYDRLNLKFSNKEDLLLIQGAMGNETVGYEITKQGERYCEIENISEVLRSEFDSTLRRVFLLLKSMSEDGLKATEENNQAKLQYCVELEETNNRLTTFCRRTLNKYGCPEEQNLTFLYCIIESLEKIADEHKYLYNFLLTRKKTGLSKETLAIWQRVNNQIQRFYHLFYTFEPAETVALARERKEIINDAFILFDKKDRTEARILHHLLIINQEIFNLLGPLIACKI